MSPTRILIACVGNIFLGDDAFGVEVAVRLARRPLPDGVRVVDFGTRGLDLAYALMNEYEAVILVDATPRGGDPGTLYLIEIPPASGTGPGEVGVEMHGMDPARVLGMVAALGSRVGRLLLVGCEPAIAEDPGTFPEGLSAPVRSAVEEAVPLIESVVERLLRGEEIGAGGVTRDQAAQEMKT